MSANDSDEPVELTLPAYAVLAGDTITLTVPAPYVDAVRDLVDRLGGYGPSYRRACIENLVRASQLTKHGGGTAAELWSQIVATEVWP